MPCLTVSAEEEKRVKGLGFLSNRGTDNFSGRVITVNGRITAQQQKAIGEAAEKFGGGYVTFTSRMTVEVPGIHYDNIEPFREFLKEYDLQTGGTGAKVRPVTSCKGTTCQYGLADTFAVSRLVHERFFVGYNSVSLPHKFKIAVGGCPNNCVKPDLNDVGIIGQKRPEMDIDSCKGCKKCAIETACPLSIPKVVEGKAVIDPKTCLQCGRCVTKCPFHAVDNGTSGLKVYMGGRWGKQISRGIPLNKLFLTVEEALDMTEQIILLYRDMGYQGERLAVMVERIGFETCEEILFSGDLLKRKEEIIAKEIAKK